VTENFVLSCRKAFAFITKCELCGYVSELDFGDKWRKSYFTFFNCYFSFTPTSSTWQWSK